MSFSIMYLLNALKKHEQPLFGVALLLMAVGMPLSTFLMSISQFMLAALWLGTGNYSEKIKRFASHPIALLFSGFYMLHVIGMSYSEDWHYGLEDLRKKLPFLILPILLTGLTPITRKQWTNVLRFFVLATLTSTLVGIAIYTGIYNKPYTDIRQISIFVSHIRLSLFIAFSFFILLYFSYKATSPLLRLGAYALIVYFLGYLLFTESFTGLVVSLAGAMVWAIKDILSQRHKKTGLIIASVLGMLVTGLSLYVFKAYTDYFTPLNPLPVVKVQSANLQVENGHYVWQQVDWSSMAKGWEKRSTQHWQGEKNTQHNLPYTLLRYLNSKGLSKDSLGVSKLSNQEIQWVEQGVANVAYTERFSLRPRLYKLFWEWDNFKRGKDVNGHSLTQRFEYWKAAAYITLHHLYWGVGTGDVRQSFEEYYTNSGSKLQAPYRLRAHNQFLELGVALGLFGLTYFFYLLLYPLMRGKPAPILFWAFWTISVFSFLNEDTLETQAGVSFFVFFSLFLLLPLKEKKVS